MIQIIVFTHPVCTGCGTAIRLTQELADENPDVNLRIHSLASASGREAAQAAQVLSVPTVFVGETRFVGAPNKQDLDTAVDQARSTIKARS